MNTKQKTISIICKGIRFLTRFFKAHLIIMAKKKNSRHRFQNALTFCYISFNILVLPALNVFYIIHLIRIFLLPHTLKKLC